MRWWVVALVLWSSSVSAEPTQMRTERYGATIAIADGISAGVLAGGIALTATSDGGGTRAVGIIGIVVGAGGYIWASPVVHHLRDRRELSKVDIGMRILVPGLAAGIAAGTASCPNDEDSCDSKTTAIFVAGGVGMVVASAVDIVWMAKQQVPYVAPASHGGVVLGLAGAF
jgi:hypothetical protein